MTTQPSMQLLHYWQSIANLTLLPPASDGAIYEFEQRHQVTLPDDLRDYYRAANGFAPPNDQDANGFCFWPIHRVSLLATFDDGRWYGQGTEQCFIFADYLSMSWAYAFCLTPDAAAAPVCIIGTASGRPVWIAQDFREFADLYVRDDERLYSANRRDA